jgi:superfamily II DNA or RNA helicase
MVLERAAATGFLVESSPDRDVGSPLHWGDVQDLGWRWHEGVGGHGQDTAWQLQPNLSSPTATLCGSDPLFYMDSHRMTCGLVRLPEGMGPTQVNAFLQAPRVPTWVIEKHQAGLLRSLGQVPQPPVLPPVETISGVKPLWRLHLSPVPADLVAVAGMVTAQLDFDYQGWQGWWQDEPVAVMVERHGQRVMLVRDLISERHAIEVLQAMGLEDEGDGMFGMSAGPQQSLWLQWADEQFAPLVAAGFVVTTDASLRDWVRRADELIVHMQPEGDDDTTSPWFDLSLGLEIGGQRINVLPWLPQWLQTLANSPLDEATGQPVLPPFVYMPAQDGPGFIRVPTDTLKPWIAALMELLGERHGEFSGDNLRLSRLEALRASASLGEGVMWAGADALRELVQQLSGRTELPEVPVPAGLQAEMRPYQHQGLSWLQFLRTHGLAGILADDMGLGKTLQTLAHILCEKEAGRLTQPALIVAPVSLLGNWQREAQRFCPGLRSLVLHGTGRHDLASNMAEVDMVIAPYSLLQRDRERWLATHWHLVVLDEAQNIKNASTQAAQVVMELSARHRVCLSGTPMENHLGEIWSLFHFLMPGFLGSQQRFKVLFRNPIEKHADGARLTQLRARITPFMLRRTKALVAGELPPKVETTMRVELTGKQADLYETIRLGMEKTVRDALATQGMAKSQIAILDALLKLRQVCCDPGLVPLEAARKVKTSAKMEQLMDVLPEMLAEGRRVLLFSQFTSMLTLIEAELKKRKLSWVKLTGQTQKRDEVIQRFTTGEVPLFLISLKAGGVGLNLPQADTVIHFDPWWNPAVENQATDRAHRIGQTQSVWVIKLVAQGTIEERILALQDRKAALANDLYSGSASRKQPLFSETDLQELLKPLGAV